ncbi:Hypothetical predicted protein [Paramuricea clavata]|uniref:Uncharacterized protein n=1 Tax=Paramuricea clavata TaxID=317549 RepID=A0A7D9DSW8_PARCT|nr:Hypothetical predicted protein [Paramuricea clavata]
MAGIIKSSLGLLFNKARDAAASKLFEGDLTDENFRGVIAREINEINKKLGALARKDLLSSLQFLKEGLNRLAMAMQKKSMNSDTPTTSQNVQAITSPAVAELMSVDGASTSQQRLNKAFTISHAVARKLEVVSLERLGNAKKSFECCRIDATRAFANEALSIDDRIMATKLRIVSRILESFLDDPEAGGGDCLLYLEELHSLPAVREMYSVHLALGRGFKYYLKSFFNQKERKRKVETVRSINTAVFDFIAGFTTKTFCHGVNWPTIELRNEIYHNIYSKERIAMRQAELNEYCRMEARWPDIEIVSESRAQTWCWLDYGPNRGTVFIHRPFVPTEGDDEANLVEFWNIIHTGSEVIDALCLATDESFWVYVLAVYESPNSALVFSILVFVSDGKLFKRIRTDLDCDSNSSDIGVFAIHTFQCKIAVLREQFDCLRVNFIDFSTGQTYHTISLPPQLQDVDCSFKPYLSILNESDIMVTRSNDQNVYIYTNEGQLKQTIPLEVEFRVLGVAFNAVSEEVLVLTSAFFETSSPEEQLLGYRLLVYSTTGALQDSYGLSKSLLGDYPLFVNYPEGRVALVRKNRFQIRL